MSVRNPAEIEPPVVYHQRNQCRPASCACRRRPSASHTLTRAPPYSPGLVPTQGVGASHHTTLSERHTTQPCRNALACSLRVGRTKGAEFRRYLLFSDDRPTARASGSVAGAAKQAPLDRWLAVDAFHARNDFRYFSDNGTRYTTEDDAWRIRTNNDVQQVSVHGRLRVRHDGWTFGVLDALLLRHGGVAGPIGDPAEDTELDTWRNLATLWGHGGVGPVRVEARAWHLGRGDVLADPYDEVGVGYTLRRDRFDTGGTQLTLRARAPGWLAWTGVLQARGESYVGTHLTTGDVLGRAQRGVLGATVEARGTWRSDVFEAVLQADVRGVVGQAPSWSGVLPRAAFTWAPSTMWALRMSGGAGFRAPTLTELFGDRGAIVGNPDLRPERGQSVDLTVAWRAQPHPTVRLAVELGGFARRADVDFFRLEQECSARFRERRARPAVVLRGECGYRASVSEIGDD